MFFKKSNDEKMVNLLTVRELASLLKLSEDYIYKLVSKRKIPFLRIGTSIRFSPEDITAWIEAKKKPSLEFFDFLQKEMQNNLSNGKKEALPMGKKLSIGRVYLRGSKWYMDFTIDGKRVRRACRYAFTQEQAVEELKMEIVQAFQGKVRHEPKAITFKQFSELYIETYAKPNKRSWHTADFYYIKNHYLKAFGSKLLTSITSFEVEDFKANLKRKGYASSSINRFLAVLKRMFSLAVEWGYCKENPVKKVKLFREDDHLKEKILTPEEEMRLLSKSSEHLKPIIITALNTGMRKSELLNLKWEDVNFRERIIRVRNTKSGKPREIPMNELVYQEFVSLRLKNPSVQYVFTNPATGEKLKSIKRAFSSVCRRAQIEGLRFHDLRHTFATRLIQNGEDIETVRKLLGHHKITITQRYLHSQIDVMRQAVESLAQIRHKEDEGLANALQKLN